MTDKRDEEQEPNFEIIDRRHTSAEEEEESSAEERPPGEEKAPPSEAGEAQPEQPPTDEQEQPSQTAAGAEAEEPREAHPMTAEDIVTMSIGLLQQQAWVNMGLVMNPATKAISKDLAQAKLAIDAVAALVNLIAPGLDDATQRELRAMVSDLQVNYVQQQ